MCVNERHDCEAKVKKFVLFTRDETYIERRFNVYAIRERRTRNPEVSRYTYIYHCITNYIGVFFRAKSSVSFL